jgi:CTP synthase (UTP-ammonia lyase)
VGATRIGVIGDYTEQHETHRATSPSIAHAAGRRGIAADVTWVPTPDVEGAAAEALAAFDALLIAPGSPYQSMQGALDAIAYARTRDVPILGTCGGFQHIVIEFARSVAGVTDAAHAETDPDASTLLIDALACSLVGEVMDVTLTEGTAAHRAYGTTRATERYYCRFGLNPDFIPTLTRSGLAISGTDADGEPRVIELPDHRFFVGTLFVPQTSSSPEAPHPLLEGLVEAAQEHAMVRA